MSYRNVSQEAYPPPGYVPAYPYPSTQQAGPGGFQGGYPDPTAPQPDEQYHVDDYHCQYHDQTACSLFLRGCLAALCCCCLLEKCCY